MRINQLVKGFRIKKSFGFKSLFFGSSQIRGYCIKVFTMFPRKPNSAVRKVVGIVFKFTDCYSIYF
jgi:ribosomal protein S12